MTHLEEKLLVAPRFKYTRFVHYATEIISKDTISCIAAHSKFFVIGTEWGNIHILDHLGYPSSKKEIHAHSTTINQISIDSCGEYIASCSNDGKVMVFGLLDDKQYPVFTFNQAIQSVAISPDFKKTFQFVTGDTRLLLVSKGILSATKHKILHENRASIRNIKWNNSTVIYATDYSVFVYDMKELQLIGIIDPNKTQLVSNNQEFYCRISWINDESFVIGWGHLIQICTIKESSLPQTALNALDFKTGRMTNICNKKVECLHSIIHPDRILGLVSYYDNILTIVDPNSEEKQGEHPMENQSIVIVIEPSQKAPDGYVEIATDQINPKCSNRSLQYRIHLEKIPYENQFYIVSSKDLISVKELEIDDKIKWFMNHKCFEQALEIFNNNFTQSSYNKKDIGMNYVEHLIASKSYSKAATICSTILDDKSSWENMIDKFLKCNFIKFILPYIPYTGSIILDEKTYRNILIDCFSTDLTEFVKLLDKWPSHLYPIQDIIDVVLREKERNKQQSASLSQRNAIITKCLGILFENNKEFDRSLHCYLQLKDPYVFKLIPKRGMFYFVNSDKLLTLLNLNKDLTLALLMGFINDVPPVKVVKILEPIPIWLFHYLNELVTHNRVASEPYHSQMVELYSEFKRDSLLSFLINSDKYDLSAAITFCRSKGFIPEVIHLLGRVGRSKEALQMIMKQEGGQFQAIEYCRERGDGDLWQLLTSFAVDKPDYIKAILENTAMDVDVKSFIRQIRSDIEIPSLKDSLVMLLINYEKQSSLISSHQQAKWNDIFEMVRQRLHFTTKAVICDVPDKKRCSVCFRPVVNTMSSIVLFRCSHVCHKLCLKDGDEDGKWACSSCIGP